LNKDHIYTPALQAQSRLNVDRIHTEISGILGAYQSNLAVIEKVAVYYHVNHKVKGADGITRENDEVHTWFGTPLKW